MDEDGTSDIVGQTAWTGMEVGDRVVALDRAIQALAVAVAVTPDNDRGFGKVWKDQFAEFLRRWQVERDATDSYVSKLFALSKVNEFQRSYAFWARDFRAKTGVDVDLPKRAEESSLSSYVVVGLVGVAVAFAVAIAIASRR